MSRSGRRDFLKLAAAGAVGTLPVSLIELSFAKPADTFTFAYISDSHIQLVKGTGPMR